MPGKYSGPAEPNSNPLFGTPVNKMTPSLIVQKEKKYTFTTYVDYLLNST
uniref:TonB-dependent receptor n=1 Tax=Heterorhabditis bacteriophora TaxID=37862 RepID=A0A1I7XI62_HETBA